MEVCDHGLPGALFWVPYRKVTQHKHQHKINKYLTYQHYSTEANHSQIIKEVFIPVRWNPTE